MWIALSLLACTHDDGPEQTVVPYVYDEGDVVTPDLDTPAIEAAIQAFVDGIRAYDAQPVLTAYDEVIATQDGYCPPYYTDENGTYWYGQCESSAGSTFNGYGFTLVYDQEEMDGYLADALGLFGVATITTAGGDVFTAGGSAYWLDGTSTGDGDPNVIYSSIVSGTFGWTGDSATGTWMADASAPDVELFGYRLTEVPGSRYLTVDGGVTGVGAADDTVVADQLEIFSEEMGSTCESEPAGSISVRGADGNWFDVLFDGPTEANGYLTPPAACDGCGTVYWRGEVLGEACADFTALLDWEVRPW